MFRLCFNKSNLKCKKGETLSSFFEFLTKNIDIEHRKNLGKTEAIILLIHATRFFIADNIIIPFSSYFLLFYLCAPLERI